MTAADVLAAARADGLELRPDGADLVVAPTDRLSPELRRQLIEHKAELMALLSTWPPECFEAERKFGQPYARLLPLLGRDVFTPYGTGELVQVFSDLASVVVGGRAIFVMTEEVRPWK